MISPSRSAANRPATDGRIRVAQVGLGEIGKSCCRVTAGKKILQLVGAADIAPDLAGQDLSSLLGIDLPSPMTVFGSIPDLIEAVRPDVVIHTTGSRLETVLPQLEEIISRSVSCVSSTEELLVPDYRNPAAAERLGKAAVKHKAALLGTGVNPGYVLDLLPVVLSGACKRIDSIRASRAVDLATRRQALREKAGVGITREEFRRKAAAGRMGHVGLMESAVLICRTLGWREADLRETIAPILAREEIRTRKHHVPADFVRGLNHIVRLEQDGQERLYLDLRMNMLEPEPGDWIEVRGDPKMEFRIPGGMPGDDATAAILVNTVPILAAARPGLHTILDLPAVRYCG